EADKNAYYYVKLYAAKLLMDHTSDTFVTPVFNGSASLRDAAGQLIEETAKGVRRKKTVDHAFIEKLYDDVTSLYRLDQLKGGSTADMKKDLGPLPKASKVLLFCIAAVWVLLGVWNLRVWLKKRAAENK
ncbi:MAG: ABC transporter substrate-binding protein, partial [Lachnospiraceae bacterium]|nr:ABC transporter substrate-binding protein [Lachnospiraceae bacterium]